MTYATSEEAIRAFAEIDNRIFFGRIFHVKPAYKSPVIIKFNQNSKKKYISGSSYKRRQRDELIKKLENDEN